MKKIWPPQDQVFWYTKRGAVTPCSQDIVADVAIVGGGMAGLSAAHAFAKKGKSVVLLEQYYCGSGATGKSSGFITPNAELSFTDFMHHYGNNAAKTIWDRISSGVETIKSNIETYQFECEYFPQDTLVLATSKKAAKILETEYQNLREYGYPALYNDAQTTRSLIGSDHYYGSFGYKNTFGINAYAYCQEMKKLLHKEGVQIFEETPVTEISGNTLKTAHAQITA